MEKISLICTVKDEAETIGPLLDSMLAQQRLPDEIVINDCGSTDATAEIVRRYQRRDPRIRLVAGGFNISSGRNNAAAAASHELLACTDAGLNLDPEWLAAIVAPLEAGMADLVGGFFQPDAHSDFELALAATNYRDVEEIEPVKFLPFGKSMAFRKQLWADVGGFPEWAAYCEDLLFAMAAERAGYRRAFAPQALVHFRPRESFAAFARQYFNYAYGDGVAGLWPKRHALRYATYGGTLLFGGLALRQPIWRVPLAGLLAAGGIAYTARPYRRLWRRSGGRPPLRSLALIPFIRLVGDVAKMAGYPLGVMRQR
jgi:glycosyltransferase involved in cell wall biosynthesis